MEKHRLFITPPLATVGLTEAFNEAFDQVLPR